MINTTQNYAKRFTSWLLHATPEALTQKDVELEELRYQMRQEFIQLRDRGLSIRVVKL